MFTFYDHIPYIGYMRYKLPRLGRLMIFIKITVYPSMQVLGLADIDNLSLFIIILVHTRLLRYAF